MTDVVHVLKLLLEQEQAVGEIFNVGSMERISIEDLAHKVRAMTNSRSDIVYVPYDQAYAEGFEDMLRRMPDVSKLQRLIGFTPQKSLDITLQETIDWIRAEDSV